jgi:hypothetical protein
MVLWILSLSCLLASAAADEKAGAEAPPLPAAPKLSSVAPAKDLVGQVDDYIHEIDSALASEDEYKDSADKVARCAHTLAVISLCLGLHDEDNQYKARAAALIKAAQLLASAADYASAKKAFDALKAAASGEPKTATQLKWEKVAALPDLMKQVPNINNKLKRNIKGSKFKTKAADTEGYTAAIAAIAQGSMADTAAAKDPHQVKQWYDFCAAMRDAAGQTNAAIHAGNEPAATQSMQKLAKTCNDCHAVFHPEAILDEESVSNP